MSFIVDFSFGHARITPGALAGLSGDCAGGIGYAGCNDQTKNITKAELSALLGTGYQMALVVENGPEDALDGTPVGTAQGKSIVADAKALGYDWQNCVLFGGADFNETSTDQYRKTLAYMEAFAAQAPVPGYYGDSDSIDFLADRHPNWVYWQSDSASFSPKNPTPNASLQQIFNDKRAGKQPVDVNNILKTPLRFMGEDMALDPKDPVVLALEKQINAIQSELAYGAGGHTNNLAQVRKDVAAVEKAVAAVQAGEVDVAALARALAPLLAPLLASHLGLKAI